MWTKEEKVIYSTSLDSLIPSARLHHLHRGKVGPLWNLVGALCHYLIIWLIRIVWNPELANLDFRVTQPTMGHTGIS